MSFWSNRRPKNLADVSNLMEKFWRRRGGRLGIGFRFRNIIRWVFWGEKRNPCLEAHVEIEFRDCWSSLWALDGFED